MEEEIKKKKKSRSGNVRKRSEAPFSKNLHKIMNDRGLTIRATAEICGVSSSVVGEWLYGAMPSDPMSALKLANALGVNFQWLLTGTSPSFEVDKLSISELFNEEDVGLCGIFKIEAKRLVRK